MEDKNSENSSFAKLPEEIVEKILCFLCSNYEQNLARLVCRLWNRLLLRIRQQRHQILTNAIKTGKLYYRKFGNCSRVGPSPRSAHSSCVLAGNLCVFGGCSPSNTAYNDFYFFNLTEKRWTKPATSGLTPAPRECATLVGYNGNLVLFGGCCQPPRSPMHLHGRFFSDVHVFNFQEKSWNTPTDCGTMKPSERAGHSASVVANTMIVFGGAQKEKRFSDVWCFNLETKKWHLPDITGKKPQERFGQSQVTMNDKSQKIIIVGGCGLTNTTYSDVWLLDVPKWTWHEVKIRNRIYAAPHIWFHPAIMVGDWVLVFASPTRTHDISAAASLMTGIPQARMKMYTMDCSQLEMNYCCSWQPVVGNHRSTSATCFHTVNVCDDIILLFGGLGNRDDARTANNSLVCVTPFWTDDDIGKK